MLKRLLFETYLQVLYALEQRSVWVPAFAGTNGVCVGLPYPPHLLHPSHAGTSGPSSPRLLIRGSTRGFTMSSVTA